ncbi:MAG: hypothetical protein JNK23_00100 [Opitutaceae bacterium]|nr:hypothetical protein [Opitutaceae bacterium]
MSKTQDKATGSTGRFFYAKKPWAKADNKVFPSGTMNQKREQLYSPPHSRAVSPLAMDFSWPDSISLNDVTGKLSPMIRSTSSISNCSAQQCFAVA